ncbi:MAG: pimeloyl-ACP methyl ester carboxylesterase [Lentimonas sp.]|jgi:pimeloyl-ACP methyl ester carboxylesterase
MTHLKTEKTKPMKPTIVLLHGALGSQHQMTKIADKFKENYKVLSFDFYGHGGNRTNKAFSIPQFVEQLDRFIEENKLTKFSIFGYSMGGYVALKYSMNKSQNIDHIFTFGTKFNWTKSSSEKEVSKMNPDLIEEKVPHFANWLKNTHGEENWKNVLNNTGKMILSLGDKSSLAYEDLEEVSCLVTISVGEEDQLVSLEESRMAVERLNRGRLAILKGQGHSIGALKSDSFSKIIN